MEIDETVPPEMEPEMEQETETERDTERETETEQETEQEPQQPEPGPEQEPEQEPQPQLPEQPEPPEPAREQGSQPQLVQETSEPEQAPQPDSCVSAFELNQLRHASVRIGLVARVLSGAEALNAYKTEMDEFGNVRRRAIDSAGGRDAQARRMLVPASVQRPGMTSRDDHLDRLEQLARREPKVRANFPADARAAQQQLDSAAFNGDETKLSLLLAGPTDGLAWGRALCSATRRGHLGALRVLAAAPCVNLAGLCDGVTAMHVAAEVNSHQAARMLLDAPNGGPRLLLQAWADADSVFATLGVGEDGRASVSALRQLSKKLDRTEAEVEVQLAFGEGEEGSRVGPSDRWFQKFWPKHRPRTSPLCIAAEIGHAEVLAVCLQSVAAARDRSLVWGHEIARVFHTAVTRGHTDLISVYAETGAFDLSLDDARGYTALYSTARLGDKVCLQALLDAKADVHNGGSSARGATPLHVATQRGHAGIIAQLLTARADVNAATAPEGFTPLHVGAAEGQATVFNQLLLAGARWGGKDEQGRTPLDVAVSCGQHGSVAELIALEAQFTYEHAPKCLTVTVLSAARLPKADFIGQNDVYVIVKAGDATQRTATIDNGGSDVEWNPPDGIRLKFPFEAGSMPSVLKFTVMDEDVGDADDMIGWAEFSLLDHGLTASDERKLRHDHKGEEDCWSRDESLRLSIRKWGKVKQSDATLQVKIALEEQTKSESVAEPAAGAAVSRPVSTPVDRGAGWTVLHAAADADHVSAVAVLMTNPNAQVMLESKWFDPASRSEWTPLMLACLRGHVNTVSCLCNAKADVGYRNGNGWDALWVAANDGRAEVVDLLLDSGASELTDRKDHQGVTPLMAAAQSGQSDTMRSLLEHELNSRRHQRAAKQRRQLERGMVEEPDEPEKKSAHDQTLSANLRTVLLAALLKSDTVILESAFALGADAGLQDQFGCSPGQHALQHAACNHLILRRLARAGTNLFCGRTMPAISVLYELEMQLGLLKRKEEPERLTEFACELKRAIATRLDGQPVWVNRIIDSTVGSHLGWDQDDLWIADTDAVVRALRTGISRLRKAAQREDARIRTGSKTYRMTIHETVLLNTVKLPEAFKRRPGLIKQIDSQIDPFQRTPLIVAVSQGNVRWFEQLLERGADIRPQDGRGWTVLHHAVAKDNLSAAKQIMDHAAAAGLHVKAYVDMEGKFQETAYELAMQALDDAREIYEDTKWDPKANEVQVAEKRQKLEHAQEFVDLLYVHGASDALGRLRVRHRRQLFCCAAAPLALLHAAAGSLALLVVSPSLNEIPIALPHSHKDYRNAFMAAAGFLTFMFLLAVLSPIVESNVPTIMFVAIIILLQVGVSSRVLREETYNRQLVRTTTPIFSNGIDPQSVLLLVLILIQVLQQSAWGFVSAFAWEGGAVFVFQAALLSTDALRDATAACVDFPLCKSLVDTGNATCDVEFCPLCRNAGICDAICGFCRDSWLLDNWFALACSLVALIVLLNFSAFSTLALSLASVRSKALQDKLPAIRADNDYRLPMEHVTVPYLVQCASPIVVYNLLRMATCVAPSDSTSNQMLVNMTRDSSAVLHASPPTQCWDGWRAMLAPFAMVVLLIWQVICSVFARFLCQPRVPYGTVGLHFAERFDACGGVIKLIMAAVAAFCVTMPVVTTTSAVLGNGVLLAMAHTHPPFAHEWLDNVTKAGYVAAIAASTVATFAATVCDVDQDGGSTCGHYPEILLVVIWIGICGSTIHVVSNDRGFGRGLRQRPALVVGDPTRRASYRAHVAGKADATHEDEESAGASP